MYGDIRLVYTKPGMTWMLTLLALLLRLPYLTQSLWLDEAIEALALKGYYGPLSSYMLSDFQPPLYHYLLQAWTSLFGYSELTLRLPSLLAGVGLTVVVIKLGSLLYTKRVGYIAGLLVATNPLLIYYSQEGRTYMLTTLFVMTSFYFLARLLQDKNSTTLSTIYYVLSTTASLWTSYLAWFVAVLELAFLLYNNRPKLALLSLLSLATLLLWLPSLLHSLSLGLGDAAANPEWGRVVGGVSVKAVALTFVKTAIGRISFTPPWFYGLVVLVLATLHILIVRRASPVHHLIYLALASLLPSLLISFFVPAYSYTRVLFVVPFYLLLLALGLSHLPRRYAGVVVLLNLVFIATFWLTPRFHREDWRSLVAYLSDKRGVVAMASRDQSPPLVYYGLTLPLIEPSRDPLPAQGDIYYLYYAEDIFDPSRLGRAKLAEAGYKAEQAVSFNSIPLEVYENRP